MDVDVDVDVPWSCCQAGVELVAQQRAIRICLVLTDSTLLYMDRPLDTYNVLYHLLPRYQVALADSQARSTNPRGFGDD